ncbi:uracil phosphoribosyltransferase [Catalinimonas alkaloidigena]|uniref:uracil phosphoribosyltransferase n=1 Tax=Catalinimonas alkaloidigena TaxID=1075417 RepID=UPI002406E92E|nr:uracil phosphoribosyltransferase [Catalinimonas alkaloidigena]MDF9795923.1 uracil phosphoribosyltransferase [Catalinimonas alkaloidigena]
MQETTLFELNAVNSLANHFLSEVRQTGFQDDRLRFRRNLERIGELLAYELSKTLHYQKQSIQTPLDTTDINLLEEQPILITILRAGLPLHQGVLNYFDQADSGFVGAFRDHHDDHSFEIALKYFTMPNIHQKDVIVIDPMLASGSTITEVSKQLGDQAQPKHLHIVSAIASPEGIDYLRQNLKIPFSIWTGAIDQKLNDMAFIVPGLGDAGDLSFGPKL